MLVESIPLATVTLGAAFVQGVLGFGFTLVALSFFLVFLGPQAVHLIVLMNLGTTLLLSLYLWRNVPVRLWLYLVLGAAIGFPIGVLAYGAANVMHLQIAAGTVVIAFSLLAWFNVSLLPANVRHAAPSARAWSLSVGVLSGFLATSLGMPGPLLILFLAGLELKKDVIRGTSIAFLAVANAAAVAFHATVVTLEREILLLALLLFPVAALGTWGGHVLSRRLGDGGFRKALLAVITASGAYALISAMN